MLKKFLITFAFFSFSVMPQAEEPSSEKKSAYRYIVENYFSKRSSSKNYYNYSRSFTLSAGGSIYRMSKDKSFRSLSSINLSFTQNVKEIKFLGDLNLKFSIFDIQMASQKTLLLEILPFITVPEVQTAFPFYVGFGLGLGMYPRYLIRQMPIFSLSSQFFVGLRFLELYHNLGFFTELNLRIQYPFSELTAYLETLSQFGLIFRF